MLLISALISGGALIASAKLYQENKRKKETPWTVYAEKACADFGPYRCDKAQEKE